MMCHAGFGGVDPVTNEYVCFLETFGGGYGGRAASDGPDAVQTHGQNTENAPVEETELNYPVRVARLSLVEDSDGAGPLPRRPRPAQGLPLRPADDVHGPFRPHDGRPGRRLRRPRRQRGRVRPDPRRRGDAAAGQDDRVPRGRRLVSYRTCGGGGYGPPEERDPARVLRDVLEEKVSVERARDVYRVAVVGARARRGRDGRLPA